MDTLLKLSLLALAAIVLLRYVNGPDAMDDLDISQEPEGFEPMGANEDEYIDMPAGAVGGPATMDSDLLTITPRTDEFAPDPDVLTGKNFLDGRRWSSINTIGGTLRNANRQIRSVPVVPRQPGISPWQTSTFEQDLMRRPLE